MTHVEGETQHQPELRLQEVTEDEPAVQAELLRALAQLPRLQITEQVVTLGRGPGRVGPGGWQSGRQ